MKHIGLLIILTLAASSSFASSVCEVYWNANFATPPNFPNGAFVVECDGNPADAISKNYQSRTASLKLLGDQGYHIVAGGERVILQKD